MDKTFFKIVITATAVFVFSWLFAYKTGVNQLPIQSEDTLPALFLPVTIIKEHTLYLDTYAELLINAYPHPEDRDHEKGMIPFYFRKAGEHFVSAFPIVTAVLALPVYFFPVILRLPITLESVTYLGHISGSLVVAFSGGFLFLLLKKHFQLEQKKALLLTSVYLFGTINFALISQALWQHGTVELLFILALWFLYEKKWFWFSFVLSLALITRPTVAFAIPFLGLIFVNETWGKGFLKSLSKLFLGILLPIAFFTWYTNKFYLALSNNGYSDQWFANWHSKFPEGFLGMWFSPSKGILIYSPILIFALVGLLISIKRGVDEKNFNFFVFASIIAFHTLILSIWKHWYGGWSFGYRMTSDVIPFFIILIVPYVQSEFYEKTKKLFYALLGFSVCVQLFGIIFFDGIWHAAYDTGYRRTGWLWSIKDSELAFNIRRVLVKLRLLERPCPHCLGIYD